MSVVQKFTATLGAIYVLVGVLGFVPALGGTTSQQPDQLLGIFGITVAHNVVHLAIGVAFLGASATDKIARIASITIGATYLLVAVIGVANIEFFEDLLNLNLADDALHVVSGGAALFFGLWGGKTPAEAVS